MTDAINFDASLLRGAITKRSERKKANNEKIISAFKEAKADKKLNKQEIKALKDMGLTEAQIKKLQASEDGMQTLNDLAYSHLNASDDGNFAIKTGDGAPAEIKQQRQAEVAEFVLDDDVRSYEEFEARLTQFDGVNFVDDELKAQLEDAYQTEKLGREKTTFTPDVKANPDARAVQIRVQAEKAENGEIGKLNLYQTTGEESKVNPDETEPTRTLVKDGKYFIEGEGNDVKYYSYNAEEGTLSEVTTNVKEENAVAAKLKSDIETLATFAPQQGDSDFETYNNADDAGKLTMLQDKQRAQQADTEKKEAIKIAFERENITKNGITIDETGSTQRYTKSAVWNTGVVVPKKATYENGYPSQIAIELPGDYGSTNADGVKQKRYSTLYFNAETNTYADKRGLRQFEVSVGDDGKITLKQKNAKDASANVRATLDNDIRIAQERAQKAALNDEQTKFKKEMSEEDVAALKAGLSNRNTAWETYLQAGTENGYLTGTLGVFEQLFDEDHAKSFNDIKPALDGLAARVPEDLKYEFMPVQDIINKLAKTPDDDVATNQFFHFYGGKIRDLDLALLDFAKNYMAGRVQGTNHANNSFLVGGSGANKVTIQPNNASSMWMTDAKFTIDGNTFTLNESQDYWIDRTVDFQDAMRSTKTQGGTAVDLKEHQGLFYNDVTGNNRLGEIKVNVEKFQKEDFYFSGDGKEHNCVVENGVVYVKSPNGQVKVPLEDVLNGRKPMPQDPPAPTTGVAGGGVVQ